MPKRGLMAALAAGLAVMPALAQRARGGGGGMSRPEMPRMAPAQQPERAGNRGEPGRGATPPPRENAVPMGVGLEQLSKLPPEQREQRLREDPGFQSLPPARQRQLLNSLQRLNAMTPQQQQQLIRRMHDLGQLTPEQRAGLSDIYQQFQTMAPDRRRAFRVAYNNLRVLPPQERDLRMNSAEFQARFSPQETASLRQALNLNLPTDVVGARPNPDFPPL